MTKASDNIFPKVTFVEGAAPASPAASDFSLYFDSADHLLKWKNSAGAVTTIATGTSTGVATDPIWDAAGDLAVGTGADTAARLAKGNAGAVLAMGNSAVIWNAGTAFPASKATNDRYFRTDLGLEFYWDGTQWVTMQIFTLPFANLDLAVNAGDTTSDTNLARVTVPYKGTFTMWLIRFDMTTFVGTTNDGTKYWTVNLKWGTAAGSFTTLASFNTSADTASNYTFHTAAVGAVVDTTAMAFSINVIKTSTPGLLLGWGCAFYRLIST